MSQAYFLIAPPGHGETPASRVFQQWILDEIGESETAPDRSEADGARR